MKVYIAGPMSGHHNHNRDAFHRAEMTLRANGFTDILNPAIIADGPWQECMKQAVAMLLTAQAVVLIPGWEKSRGATIEAKLAHDLDIPRFYLDPSCLSREEAARIRRALSVDADSRAGAEVPLS